MNGGGPIIPTVTFDLDGTLIDSPFARIVLPWLDAEFAKLGIPEARALLRREQLRRFAQGLYVRGYDWDDIVQTVAANRGVQFARMIGTEMESGKLAEALGRFTPYPDVLPALARLRTEGYRIVAVSNGFTPYQRATLDRMGIGGCFDAIVGPDRTGFAKPDPRMLAAEWIGRPVAAHLGDLVTQDIVCARLGGIPAVLVVREDPHTPALQAYAEVSPLERPRRMLEDGWLDRRYVRELRDSRGDGLAAASGGLPGPGHPAVPDAVIFTLDELWDILRHMDRESEEGE